MIHAILCNFVCTICSKCIFVICTQLDFASISFFANFKNIYKIFVSSYFRMFIPKSVILNQNKIGFYTGFCHVIIHVRGWSSLLFTALSVRINCTCWSYLIKNEYNYTKIMSRTLLRPVQGMKGWKPNQNFKFKTVQNFKLIFAFFRIRQIYLRRRREHCGSSWLQSSPTQVLNLHCILIWNHVFSRVDFENFRKIQKLKTYRFVLVTVKCESFKRKSNFSIFTTR